MYALPLLLALTVPFTTICTNFTRKPHWLFLHLLSSLGPVVLLHHHIHLPFPPSSSPIVVTAKRSSLQLSGTCLRTCLWSEPHRRCMITEEFSVINPLYYSYHPISSSFFATWAGAFDVAVMGKKSRLTMNTKEKRRNMIGDDGKYGWRGRQTNL